MVSLPKHFLSYLSKQAAVRASPVVPALVGDAAQEAPEKVLPLLGALGVMVLVDVVGALCG
ncbi:hypothetical protein J3R82DRAFT_3515 [Butyriboletus roseoflavus]|nr:hypothetical protein J3R82DRAFT_3515 [Butyriboletus roseoflavus]